MSAYLFVWETLSIPETPEGDQQEHQRHQQEHHRETNELKSELVHMSLIETPAGAPERHQQEHQRKARCNYPINYLKCY